MTRRGGGTSLAQTFRVLLEHPDRPRDLTSLDPENSRDLLESLLIVQSLHTAPLSQLGDAVWLQHDPGICELKSRLERAFLQPFLAMPETSRSFGSDDAAATIRRIAHVDLVPPVYDRIAARASYAEIVAFLEVEGGPDGGFDDLVALAQVGIDGVPKVALALNYWDEMGRGDVDAVHTRLHRQLSEALDMRTLPESALPLEALQRSVLNGVLVTNRGWQPEAIGALGLLECQAGPRCRRVLAGLARVGAPTAAFAFYEEHASADPRHGTDWLARIVAPLAETMPGWGPRIVRGARWRAAVNHALFSALEADLAAGRMRAAV